MTARPKVVVLGGAGLLGRHLVEELRAPSLADSFGDVRAVDRAGCDVTRAEAVLDATAGAGWIVNCAAFTNVDGAESQADDAWRINALGAEHAARAALHHGATLLHVSTDFVFDDSDEPLDEFARPRPRSVYARSKFAGEELAARTGCRLLLARVQALYGRGGRGFSSRLPELLRERKPLKLDGERRVQPTWVRATARQIAVLMRYNATGTFHVSCTGSTTWAGFARALCDRLGVPAEFEEVPSAALVAPAARPRNCVFEHRMLRLRGLMQLPDWRDALDEYLREEAQR
jgi:dTDP-4-dehydrorhamnose reductase